MKKLKSILRNVLACLGAVTIVAIIVLLCTRPYYDIYVGPSTLALCPERVDSLRSSGPYMKDTTDYRIAIHTDSIRAEEIRKYFLLDTLYAADADTWTKTMAIGKFVARNIPHDNQREWPQAVDAIGLWEYTKNVAPAFNCRLHSILTFELLLAAGIEARYVTCMPQDQNDNDCHVVNEVWVPEWSKWAMIDTDMDGHYVTDLKGIPLSLQEMREYYISDEKMMMCPLFGKGTSKKDWYYAYMAKNTYWFSCWGDLSYYQEDYDVEGVNRDNLVVLIPSRYMPVGIGDGNILTTDAERFWAAPDNQ